MTLRNNVAIWTTLQIIYIIMSTCAVTNGYTRITTTEFIKNRILVNWTGNSSCEYEISVTRDGVPISGEQNVFVNGCIYTITDALRSKNFTITVSEKSKPQLNDTVTFHTPSLVRTTAGSSLTLAWPLTASADNLRFGYKVMNMDTSTVYIDIAPPSVNVQHPSFKFNGVPGKLTTTTNITIRNIAIDEAGYITSTGVINPYGGVVLAVDGKPSQPDISGDTSVEEGMNTTLHCSSRPNTSPDYVDFPGLTYQWFVNKSDALPKNFVQNGSLLTTARVKKTDAYQRISCRAFQNRTASDFSKEVNVNVLYKPVAPSNVSYRDVQLYAVIITWISEFNGGSEQRFLIEQISPNGNILVGNISDPGQGKRITYVVDGLLPKWRYRFQIISTNFLGDTRNISEILEVITKEGAEKMTTTGNDCYSVVLTTSTSLSAALVVAFVIIVVLSVKQRNLQSQLLEERIQRTYADVNPGNQEVHLYRGCQDRGDELPTTAAYSETIQQGTYDEIVSGPARPQHNLPVKRKE